MELDSIEYQMLGQGIVSEIRSATPKVSGNLAFNTRFYGTGFGDIWGHIVIDTPYAAFVDYGHITHPNSKKLSKDYLYVEKAINRSLRIYMRKKGLKVNISGKE